MLHRLLACTLFITGFLAFIQTSQAQLSVSDQEKAVFAFMKLTNQEPNLKNWIVNSTKYQKANKFDRESLLETEETRLGWGFGTYDVTKDFIKVKSKIRLTTEVNADNKRVLNVSFAHNSNETPYFPFPYGEEWIAFIINDLIDFKTITLKPEEVPKVKQYFYDAAPYEAEIEIRLRPLTADATAPLEVDGTEQWLMLGDVAYLKIEFYDKFKFENVLVWDYNAPWYLSESQKALLELFKE